MGLIRSDAILSFAPPKKKQKKNKRKKGRMLCSEGKGVRTKHAQSLFSIDDHLA
jgi:hypothetical protein